MEKGPLVSIMIPNYNYGHYLANCFESVLNQTYRNIEVIFRDNNSTDNSMKIAMDYFFKFREKGIPFMIANNRFNLGSDKNTNLCLGDASGVYQYVLASDDAIAPTFIERCVEILERYPGVSMVMTHRIEMDENGKLTEQTPFYNQSCVINSEEQLAVFMMAGIAIPGQRMGKVSLINKMAKYVRVHNVAGDWYNNFLYACAGDVAYIAEPLFYYRVHSGNETSVSEDKLVGTFEHYLLLDSFVHIANEMGMKKPQLRYEAAVKKLGSMCLRYALKMYENDKQVIAKKYLRLALVYDEEIEVREEYVLLWNMKDLEGQELRNRIKDYKSLYELNRTISYDPPEGSMPIM